MAIPKKTLLGIQAGARLARLLDIRDMSQKDVADILGIQQSAVSQYLKGGPELPVKHALKLREHLGVDLDWIYAGDTGGITVHSALQLTHQPIVRLAASSEPIDQKPSRRGPRP